mmetsp:Transcript_57404/g.171224  ORF Transcript_57404/g.171224 Transcript_57404/m.171224 type:complete len:383 (-) Transcript_57404:192-1340(-)
MVHIIPNRKLLPRNNVYCTSRRFLTLGTGFYQAVNIGYSIGYGFPREPKAQNWWFSSAYVVVGASFVGVALGFFADKIVEDSAEWFSRVMEKEQYEADTAPDKPFHTRLRAMVRGNKTLLRPIGLWLCWVAVMIAYSMIAVKWPFSAAQYFAISTCSTGGHMPIPDESPQWLFGVTGVFAAIGVPLMGVAMASLGSLFMDRQDDLGETQKMIQEDVTAEELLDLQRYGLEDGDGEIDKAEYVILCMVRLGTDPRLVQFISDYFKTLDDDQSNSLSILEITRGRVSCDDLQRLSKSEGYQSSRRLSLALDDCSLTSICELEESEDVESRGHDKDVDDTDSEGDKFHECVESPDAAGDTEAAGDTPVDDHAGSFEEFLDEGICF